MRVIYEWYALERDINNKLKLQIIRVIYEWYALEREIPTGWTTKVKF